MLADETYEVNALTKIYIASVGRKAFYIESSDYQIRYQLSGVEQN